MTTSADSEPGEEGVRMAQRTRPGLVVQILTNFVRSLKLDLLFPPPKQLIGKDPFGNSYYEVPHVRGSSRTRSRRWFESVSGESCTDGFDAPRPAEWEAWLRHRRHYPPTDLEVAQSLQLADLKKRNAARLEAERMTRAVAPPSEPLVQEFPKYDNYELNPGEAVQQDRWSDFKNPYLEAELLKRSKKQDPVS